MEIRICLIYIYANIPIHMYTSLYLRPKILTIPQPWLCFDQPYSPHSSHRESESTFMTNIPVMMQHVTHRATNRAWSIPSPATVDRMDVFISSIVTGFFSGRYYELHYENEYIPYAYTFTPIRVYIYVQIA